LVGALGDLARRGTEAHLLIVGDGPERGAIEARVRGEGLSAATTFTGAVDHSAIPAWLAAMDIAVAPYAPAECFYFSPLKLYEYLAAGRPVVAADVGPLAAAICHGETGRLYRAGNSGALADALATLIADPAAAAGLGEAGQAFVRRHHTWDGNARAVEAMVGASTVAAMVRSAA
jgi:glycosyltransferase involved in cell wall biosynthesis